MVGLAKQNAPRARELKERAQERGPGLRFRKFAEPGRGGDAEAGREFPEPGIERRENLLDWIGIGEQRIRGSGMCPGRVECPARGTERVRYVLTAIVGVLAAMGIIFGANPLSPLLHKRPFSRFLSATRI